VPFPSLSRIPKLVIANERAGWQNPDDLPEHRLVVIVVDERDFDVGFAALPVVNLPPPRVRTFRTGVFM
jgi:hypothetical protein